MKFPDTVTNRLFSLFLLITTVCLNMEWADAQSANSYRIQVDSTASLLKDKNGNSISWTSLPNLIANDVTAVTHDILPIGFDFIFMGKKYSDFRPYTYGNIELGNGSWTGNVSTNTLQSGAFINNPRIAPFWEELRTPKTGFTTRAQTLGTAPTRTLVVEWRSLLNSSSSTDTTYDARFQLRLYEETGEVEFVYGQMKLGVGSGTVSASIGFSAGAADGLFQAVTSLNDFSVTTLISEEPASRNLGSGFTAGGFIPQLNSADTLSKRICFVPDSFAAPTNLRTFSVTRNSALLYWDDNANNEVKYEVYLLDPEKGTSLDTLVGANINFRELRNLIPGTIYTYQVAGYSEGFLKYSNVHSFMTSAPALKTAVSSGDWTDTLTWGGPIPGTEDSVVIRNQHVHINTNQAMAHQVVLDSGAVLSFDSTANARSLTVTYDVVINKGAVLTAANTSGNRLPATYTHTLNLGRNLRNAGIYDAYVSDTVTGRYAGIVNQFNRTGNSILMNDSGRLNLFQINLQKAALDDTLSFDVDTLLVRGSATDSLSGAGFINTASFSGTLWLNGNFVLENRVFQAAAYVIPTNARLILDNPNLLVTPQAGTASLGGGLRLIRGELNIGSNNSSQLNIAATGAILQVDGGKLNIATGITTTATNIVATYTFNGGLVRLGTLGAGFFRITANNSLFHFNDGRIILQQGNPSITTNILSIQVPAVHNSQSRFDKTVFQLGSTLGSADDNNFLILGHVPHLFLDSASATLPVKVRLSSVTMIRKSLYLGADDTLFLNGTQLRLMGDSVVNNGLITNAGAAATDNILLNAENDVLYKGSGLLQSTALNVEFPDSGSTFQLAAPLAVNNLNLFQGALSNSQYLQLGLDSLSDAQIQIGSATGTMQPKPLDSLPRFVAKTVSFTYNAQLNGTAWVIGKEIPAIGSIHNLTLDNPAGVRLPSRNLEVLQQTHLKRGVLHLDNGYEFKTGLANTSFVYYAGDQSWVKGRIRAQLPANQASPLNITLPLGVNRYSPLYIQQFTSGAVQPELTVAFTDTSASFNGDSTIEQINSKYFWTARFEAGAASINSLRFGVPADSTDALSALALFNDSLSVLNPAAVFRSSGARSGNNLIVSENVIVDTIKPVYFITAAGLKPDTLGSDTFYIGTGQDFLNLTAVAEYLKRSFITGSPVFELTRFYDVPAVNAEVFPIVFERMRFDTLAAGKVTIRLANDVTDRQTANRISPLGASQPLLVFDGANNLELDGRGRNVSGQLTGNREWEIAALTNTGANPTILIQNDTRELQLTGLDIKGNSNQNTTGTIAFGGTIRNNGNDHITVSGCSIGSEPTARAQFQVFSQGDAAFRNDHIRILDNEIYNYNASGVNVTSGNGNNWEISGNHFYYTGTVAHNAATVAINFVPATGSSGNTISYNYIGGSAPKALGSTWNNGNLAFTGINLIVDTMSTTQVTGNVIRNTTLGGFTGIQVQYGKSAVFANTIGDTIFSYQIISTGTGIHYGIYYTNTASGNVPVYIENNVIRGIYNRTALSSTRRFQGIVVNRPDISYLRIANNHIGNFTSTGVTTDVLSPNLCGILVNAPNIGWAEVSGNIVDSFTTKGYGSIYGILLAGANTKGVVNGNLIRRLKTDSTYNTQQRFVVGIQNYTGIWSLQNNMILLEHSRPHAAVVLGIRVANTASASELLHNTVILSGLVTANNRNSFALVYEPQQPAIIQNNILVNLRRDAALSHSAAVFNQTVDQALLKADHNLFYAVKPDYAITLWTGYYSNVSNAFTVDSFANIYGNNTNSIGNFLPLFADTLLDAHLLNTTDNCPVSHAGIAISGLDIDFDAELRTGKQPDLGADAINLPQAPAPLLLGGNDTLCAGLSRELVVNNASGSGWINWYATADGNRPIAVGDTLNTGLLNAGDTAFYAAIMDGNCLGERLEVKIHSLSLPEVLVPQPLDPYCNGSVVVLNAITQAGTQLFWYADSLQTQLLAAADTLNLGALTADTMVYILADNGCQSVVKRIDIKIDTNGAVLPPVVPASLDVCYNESIRIGALAADTVYWFNTPTALVPVYVGDSLLLNGLQDTVIYYAAVKSGTCISARSRVQVNVKPPVAAPAADTLYTVCVGAPLQLKATGPGLIYWFDTETAVTPLLQDSVLNLATVNQDTFFYAAQMLNGCMSERTRVMVNTIPVAAPLIPTLSPLCYNTPVSITVTKADAAHTIRWYADAAGTVLLNTGETFVSGNLLSDTVYFVNSSFGGCSSLLVPCSVVVQPEVLPHTLAKTDTICYGTRFSATTLTAGASFWYADTLAAPFQNGNFFESDPLFADTFFYVLRVVNGCNSRFDRLNVTVIQPVQIPVTDTVVSVCQGERLKLSAAGTGNIRWYSTPTGLIPLNTDSVWFTPAVFANTSYYVENEVGACRSRRLRVQVTVLQKPAAPVVNFPALVCYNESPVLQVNSVGERRWYSSANGNLPFSSDSLLVLKRLKQDTTVYLELFNGTCSSERFPVEVRVLNITEGLQLNVPDTVDVNADIQVTLAGPLLNQYSVSFGQGASPSSASGSGPFQVKWTTVGQKTLRLTVSRTSGSVFCDSIIQRSVFVRVPLGKAENLNADMQLKAYPIPADEQLYYSFPFISGETATITLENALGMNVLRQVADSGNGMLEVGHLSAGVYLLRLEQAGRVYTTRIILQ